MNILQVIPYFAFARGGDVNVCYNLTKQLIKQGHKVTILTTTFDYNKEDTDNIENLKMVPIEYKFNLSLFIYSPKMKKWLKEHITEYDIIHLHQLRSYQNNIIINLAKKHNIPYILQPHASTPKDVNKQLFKEAYDFFYGNRIMQNATATIAVSNEEAYYDKKMKAKNVQVIYNGMNLDEFKKEVLPGMFKRKYDINSKYLLYLGRLDKLKGINYIIEAFSLLPDKYDEYKLVIVGRINQYKEELDKIIDRNNLQDRVIFTDYVTEEDKIYAYNDAEMFINPVKYMGGVSITVFESILSNTPVIVTPESGEVIENIDAGLIVEYANVEQLKDAMIKTFEDKNLVNRQLKNGQDYIYNNLSWKTVTDKIITIYENALKGD